MSEVTGQVVMGWFERLCAVPRATGAEAQVSAMLRDHATARGLQVVQDPANNLVIRKPAHPGQDDRPPLILQAHLDMVAAAEPGVRHDFATDPIRVLREGDVLRAEGTTLGADNGIGVSIAMAILDSDQVRHPDLEVLLTTGEESGLLGAKALAPGTLTGRYLLNMDGEQEGVFLTSCAGGATFDVTFSIASGEVVAPVIELELTGLAGGHSGLDIDKGRVNGVQAVARLLRGLGDDVRLASVQAPGAFNAINRECRVVFAVPEASALAAGLSAADEAIVATEPAAYLTTRVLDEGAACLDAAASRSILAFLTELPNGVHTMSAHLPGVVESSLNIGVVATDGAELTVTVSTRSSAADRHRELRERITQLAQQYGGRVAVYGEYPAWQFDPDNPLLGQAVQIYRELFGEEPHVTGVHGGLECGVLAEANPGVAMLSVGAELTDCHTPRERASIASIDRLTQLVVGIVEAAR